MGLGALLWPAESSWPGWSLKAAPQPPRVMVNRGKSGVRVSVPMCRPSLFVASFGGFWRAVVWQGQSGGWGVCCCSRGSGESPVQAALSSAGWEKSWGSSPRVKSRKKALSFCFHGCCVPSTVALGVWSVCPPGCLWLSRCDIRSYFGPLVLCSVATKSHRHNPLPGMVVSTQEVQPLNHNVLSRKMYI